MKSLNEKPDSKQQQKNIKLLVLVSTFLGFGVVNRKVRGPGHVQLPGKLIDRSFDFALLTSALSDHQLDILVVQNTDEVTFGIAVVQGNVIHLEDTPDSLKSKDKKCKLLQKYVIIMILQKKQYLSYVGNRLKVKLKSKFQNTSCIMV